MKPILSFNLDAPRHRRRLTAPERREVIHGAIAALAACAGLTIIAWKLVEAGVIQ